MLNLVVCFLVLCTFHPVIKVAQDGRESGWGRLGKPLHLFPRVINLVRVARPVEDITGDREVKDEHSRVNG